MGELTLTLPNCTGRKERLSKFNPVNCSNSRQFPAYTTLPIKYTSIVTILRMFIRYSGLHQTRRPDMRNNSIRHYRECLNMYEVAEHCINRSGVYSIEGGAGDRDTDVCSRSCLLHLLLAPCSACSMAHNKIRRVLLLGLGITTFMLGQYNQHCLSRISIIASLTPEFSPIVL